LRLVWTRYRTLTIPYVTLMLLLSGVGCASDIHYPYIPCTCFSTARFIISSSPLGLARQSGSISPKYPSGYPSHSTVCIYFASSSLYLLLFVFDWWEEPRVQWWSWLPPAESLLLLSLSNPPSCRPPHPAVHRIPAGVPKQCRQVRANRLSHQKQSITLVNLLPCRFNLARLALK